MILGSSRSRAFDGRQHFTRCRRHEAQGNRVPPAERVERSRDDAANSVADGDLPCQWPALAARPRAAGGVGAPRKRASGAARSERDSLKDSSRDFRQPVGDLTVSGCGLEIREDDKLRGGSRGSRMRRDEGDRQRRRQRLWPIRSPEFAAEPAAGRLETGGTGSLIFSSRRLRRHRIDVTFDSDRSRATSALTLASTSPSNSCRTIAACARARSSAAVTSPAAASASINNTVARSLNGLAATRRSVNAMAAEWSRWSIACVASLRERRLVTTTELLPFLLDPRSSSGAPVR